MSIKTTIQVTPIVYKLIEVLPDAWHTKDYLQLLDAMDYGDTSSLSPQEAEEMCLLSLADNEPPEAAELILTHLFDDVLTKGQIQNLSHEMQDEQPWEEYADLSLHEMFFNAGQILYSAFNGTFPHPKAVLFEVDFEVKKPEELSVFAKEIEPQIIRILSQGMPDNALIKRLFDDQIAGGKFPEAENILWQLTRTEQSSTSIRFQIISSLRWFETFKHVDAYEATLVYES